MNILCLDGHTALAEAMAQHLGAKILPLERRLFPDQEYYFNLTDSVQGEDVLILCHLHQPNDKSLALWFMARHLRDMGARSIGLLAPYLAYMRQDIRFQPGESLTSRYFAELISQLFDWMITVDPHLHRYHNLGEIYSIPSMVLHATTAIATHIAGIEEALVVGPDEESAQWAREVATAAGCEHLVLNKVRSGDRDVAIQIPNIDRYRKHRPILVDDIISTGRTMLRTAEQLVRQGLQPPLCIGVHAVFAPGAEVEMRAGPIADIHTCNCIPHATNRIDLSAILAEGVLTMFSSKARPS